MGVFIAAGFGSAGMLSAIDASAWMDSGDIIAHSDDMVINGGDKFVIKLMCYRAARFLVGTSVRNLVLF